MATKKKRPRKGKLQRAPKQTTSGDNIVNNNKAKAPTLDGTDYRKLPSLAAYINRVGAEQRNFRRFVIKQEEREHYHYDRVVININDKKEIELTTKGHLSL